MADIRIIVDQANVVRVERTNRGLVFEGVKDVLNAKDLVDLFRRTNPVPVVGRVAALFAAEANVENSPVLTAEEKAAALEQLRGVYVYDDVTLSERPGELERMRAGARATDNGSEPPSGDRLATGIFDP